MVMQKSNIGHIYKIIRYKTLKLLRSYSALKGQERVNPKCRESYLLLSCAGWEGLGLLLLVNLDNNNNEVFMKV